MFVCVLQRLDVGLNQFSGSFDELLGECSYIVSFKAEENTLSGPLPPEMASLGLMVRLHISFDIHLCNRVCTRFLRN